MAKVTSKLQVTIPRAIARTHRIEPGMQLEFESAGDAIRLRIVAAGEPEPNEDLAWRLKLFREATSRQDQRNRRDRRGARRAPPSRGWSRDDLHDRGLPR